MGKVIFNNSVSLDGFVAGLNNEVDQLFRWYSSGDTELPMSGPGYVFKVSSVSAKLMRSGWSTIGTAVTGRRNFDNAQGWGGHPPGEGPHFVVTHRVPQEWVYAGSPFTFVTDGVESAIAQAKQAAGDKNVVIESANIMQQALAAGLLDELQLDLAPVLLGTGIPLFDPLNKNSVDLESLGVIEGTGVTHLRFRVMK